ncbi:hypothetical protein [Flavobacterium sp.]|uniref:hypothetical protein n=1 Tax=Flavobacterium sp. TaxID=239 RepID=UPI00260AEE64|nr:hypothetical protein [Flavobacterium sp.]
MASLTYNLKKYLKFITRKPISQAEVVATIKGKVQTTLKTTFYQLQRAFRAPLKLPINNLT